MARQNNNNNKTMKQMGESAKHNQQPTLNQMFLMSCGHWVIGMGGTVFVLFFETMEISMSGMRRHTARERTYVCL